MQAHARAGGADLVEIETDAVVLHLQVEAALVQGEGNAHGLGAGVALGVGHGLLDDAVEGGADLLGQMGQVGGQWRSRRRPEGSDT